MKRTFDERQIIGVLREIESGITVAALCRKHSISESTYYKWRTKYSGMSLSDREKLEKLEAENAQLKYLLAESILTNVKLRERSGEKLEVLAKSTERTRGDNKPMELNFLEESCNKDHLR